MTPEIELMRARELALAAQNASQLFWIIVIGTFVIFAFWTMVQWRISRRNARQRRVLLGCEVRRHTDKNALYDEIAWQEFCDRNGLPESTRITLMASVRGENRKVQKEVNR